MSTSEMTPVVEKSKEKTASNVDSNSGTKMENSTTEEVQKSSEKRLTLKETLRPKGPFMRNWNIIFIVSCVFAVLLDPLFLYIPIINEDMKCVRLDKNLKIAALVLRSVTDICYLLDIFFQVYGSDGKTNGSENPSTPPSPSGSRSSILTNLRNILLSIAKTMLEYSYILIDILAVLPLPQVGILILFSKMRGSGSGSFNTWTLMNFLVLVQYVPRVLRIYLSCKASKNFSSEEETPIWLKAVLNFYMYILASHVLGALWYFFAAQRITTCWQHACRKENGCNPNNFECHDHHTLRNITFLNDLCPIDPENAKVVDFGIFLDILQFGILGSTNYPEKFSNCFWWGLRNLSSLGSNLQPSINTWENLFAALISIIGLLLFLYLIGNLQTYMQLETAKIEECRWDARIQKKVDKKRGEVEPWLSKNGIPSRYISDIMGKVEAELKGNKVVDVNNLLSEDSILPRELRNEMEGYLPMSRLQKVPLLENMDKAVWKAISEYLEPKKYKKNDIIIEEDKPLEMMIFIVDGKVSIEMRDCPRKLQLRAGDLYGEKILSWPSWTSSPGASNESARAITDVEVLVLMASDMESVGHDPRLHFGKETTLRTGDQWGLLTSDLVTMLRKVPKFKTMDTQVLKALSRHLKDWPDEHHQLSISMEKNQPLRMMIFVMDGTIDVSRKDGKWLKRSAGYFLGEQLLDYVLDRSFPAVLPLSTFSIWANDYVELRVLMATDLAKYRSHFSKVITHPTNLCSIVGLTRLKAVSIFKSMDDLVLKEISERLEHKSYSDDTVVIERNKPLEMMFFLIDGSEVVITDQTTTSITSYCSIGEFYGSKLAYWVINWASHTNFPANLPLSNNSAKVNIDKGKAEVFVLTADNLKIIVSKFRSHFMKKITTLPMDSEGKLSTFDPLTRLKKVPLLKYTDDYVLKAMCQHLKTMEYNDTSPCIIKSNEKLNKMFFIVKGLVSFTKYREPEFYRYSGSYFGEQLLEWVADTSFPKRLPEWSDKDVEAVGDVEVLVLMSDDLVRVVSEFKSFRWNIKCALPKDLHLDLYEDEDEDEYENKYDGEDENKNENENEERDEDENEDEVEEVADDEDEVEGEDEVEDEDEAEDEDEDEDNDDNEDELF